MILCIDIGNTNTVLGLADAGAITKSWRIRTDPRITSDELFITVNHLFAIHGIDIKIISDVIISCVVPPVLHAYENFTKTYLNISSIIVDHSMNIGIKVVYPNPSEIGTDRLLTAAAAWYKFGTALVIIDFGTATTFDYVNGNGEYIGGVISPGIMISAEALFSHASKLPRVEIFKAPSPSIIATDTVNAISSGIIYGYAGLVDSIVARMKKEKKETTTVVATGGFATLISRLSESIDDVDELLLLKGLVLVHKEIKTKK